jgi:hypothetical protein
MVKDHRWLPKELRGSPACHDQRGLAVKPDSAFSIFVIKALTCRYFV